MTTPLPLRVLSTGLALPDLRVESSQLEQLHHLQAGWIQRNVGVSVRYYCADHQDAPSLARTASASALQQAGLDPSQIDLVIAACGTYPQPLPYRAASLLRDMVSWFPAVASFDVDATCLSFVVACQVVANAFALGQHQRALVLCSEVTSPGLDWRYPEAAALFGDGAVAVVFENDAGSSLLETRLQTYPEGAGWCQIPGGGSRFPPSRFGPDTFGEFLFQMNGKELFRLVADKLPLLVEQLLREQELDWSDLALVLPHQASPSAMRLVRRRLGCPEEKFFSVVATVGNLVAASIPAALHMACQAGRLQRGDLVLLLGTSAGVSLGACILRY